MNLDAGMTTQNGSLPSLIINDDEFKLLTSLAKQQTGIVFGESKRSMFQSRVLRRLRQTGMSSISEYCERLLSGDQIETIEFVNLITTNLTSFFREPHHFHHLETAALPGRRALARSGQPLRIFSAGCSTGEEPYSIAISALESLDPNTLASTKIFASDLDTRVLTTASSGVYDAERVSEMEGERVHRWFDRGKGENAGKVRVRPHVRKLVDFRRLNLISNWSIDPFDVIFCRNVIIYFDSATRRALIDRFADHLFDGGYLYIGHSETLFQVSERFKPLGRTIYQKVR